MNTYMLDTLKQIASAMAVQFGSECEVVIHDLSRSASNCSIVHIENGHVSGRKLGDGPSKAILSAIHHHEGRLKDKLSYLTKTDDGHILKSSTVYIHDEDLVVRYILSINYDVTNLLALEKSIQSLAHCPDELHSEDSTKDPKHITHDVNQLLDELIEQSVAMVGTPLPLMSKEEKIKAINFLNDAGAFLITKSGDKIAKYFGISKYTLYSYVDINK